jgi:hypothetical protein
MIGDRIVNILKKTVEAHERIRKLTEELGKVTDETSSLSPMEIETKLTEEIEYIRDLVKLSANRLRTSPTSIIFGKYDIATIDSVKKILDHIEEFDPKVYKNGRVAIFGKPAIVIIPGTGNGVYDWKNNALIIPTIPYTTLLTSVVSALVEYRIDVDEEKKLMFSYSQIKEYAGIKSVWKLRENFLKDYIIWMNQEYQGYKVLKSDVRNWFEHEIGPNKNQAITPLCYESFSMSQKQYEELVEQLEAKTSNEDLKDPEAWFGNGIISCQNEKWEQAVEYFKKTIELEPTHPQGLYNLGFACMKANRKPDAVDYFKQYLIKNPSGWWTGVARDHLNRLR